MKLLFMSDLHGSLVHIRKIPEIFARVNPDYLVLLGDLYNHKASFDDDSSFSEILDILERYSSYLYVVKGNCDSEIDSMMSSFPMRDYLLLQVNGKRVFCSHGNRYDKNHWPAVEFDIMASGHTHVGSIEQVGNHIFVNPGSLSYPRGSSLCSYLVLSEEGVFLYGLEGNLLKSLYF